MLPGFAGRATCFRQVSPRPDPLYTTAPLRVKASVCARAFVNEGKVDKLFCVLFTPPNHGAIVSKKSSLR